MVTISLSENEAQVLLQLIDIAVKAQGIAAAEAGIVLTKKIQEGFKNKTEQPPTSPFPPEK
jgi:hypothetical protein